LCEFPARCAHAGLRRITVHDARRTRASLRVDLDVHPRVAMQVLRHAQFSITMEIYTQVTSAQTREDEPGMLASCRGGTDQ
jgi:integrase